MWLLQFIKRWTIHKKSNIVTCQVPASLNKVTYFGTHRWFSVFILHKNTREGLKKRGLYWKMKKNSPRTNCLLRREERPAGSVHVCVTEVENEWRYVRGRLSDLFAFTPGRPEMPACRRAKLNMHMLQIEYQLRNLLLELQIFAQVDTVLGANLRQLAVLSQTSQLLFSTLMKQTGFHTKCMWDLSSVMRHQL